MDRKDFAQILNSVIIPEGCDSENISKSVFPISEALVQMMPNKLFRYRCCSESTIEAFKDDKVYAVTADMFNDPYDMLLRFDKEAVKQKFTSLLSKEILYILKDAFQNGMDFPDIIKKYIDKECLSKVKTNLLSITDDPKIKILISNRKNEIENMVDCLFPLLGRFVNKRAFTISCFSETIKSVTMWSHYADYHKGFALEYNLRHTLFNSIPNVGIYPVIYSNNRYDGTSYIMWELLKLQGINLPNPDTLSHLKCALYKSSEWEYEQEWRLIDCTIRNSIMSKNNTCISLHPTAIYYGNNISDEYKKRLHDIAMSKGINEYNMHIDYASEKYEMLYQ